MFYLPTQLAGPVLPFNAFYSQVVRPQTTHSLSSIVKYGLWLLICLVTMEVLTHAAPAMAVAGSGAYVEFQPLQVNTNFLHLFSIEVFFLSYESRRFANTGSGQPDGKTYQIAVLHSS